MSVSELKVGDQAPAFSSPDQNGDIVSLDQFSGKKVLLYFYPKDDTPGCTAEACSFRDNYEALSNNGIEVLGVSIDDTASHKKFSSKYALPFTLLADTEKKIVEDYRVWGEKSMYGKKYMGISRKSFLIDEQGKIQAIIDKVDTKNASAQVLDLIK